jgi:hypothetical protein
VLQVSDSGGSLVDGKAFADAIRANTRNDPDGKGRCVPSHLS